MAKKITKSSGLSDIEPPKAGKPNDIKKSRSKLRAKNPRGFRLTLKDQEVLRDITTSVEELTYSKLSDTQTLRALIYLGKDIEPNVILAKIRETSV